jgi:hypothetical protein
MKTLKLLFLTCLVACFSIGISYAQSPKTTIIETDRHIQPYWLPCFNEYISGGIYYYRMWVNNKYQNRAVGELIGETTGNVYKIMQVINENWNGWSDKGGVYSYLLNLQVHLDGKLVFTIHENYHVTYNANGELVVELDNWWTECK